MNKSRSSLLLQNLSDEVARAEQEKIRVAETLQREAERITEWVHAWDGIVYLAPYELPGVYGWNADALGWLGRSYKASRDWTGGVVALGELLSRWKLNLEVLSADNEREQIAISILKAGIAGDRSFLEDFQSRFPPQPAIRRAAPRGDINPLREAVGQIFRKLWQCDHELQSQVFNFAPCSVCGVKRYASEMERSDSDKCRECRFNPQSKGLFAPVQQIVYLNDVRDEWLWIQHNKVDVKQTVISKLLEKECELQGWDYVEVKRQKDAANAWAKRNGMPPIPIRPKGRKPQENSLK